MKEKRNMLENSFNVKNYGERLTGITLFVSFILTGSFLRDLRALRGKFNNNCFRYLIKST